MATSNFWSAAAAGVAVATGLMRWYVPIDPDAGLTLTAAWQVSQGLVPYRDFFEFHPPGAFYLLAAVFRLVSPSYLAAKAFSVVVTLLGAWALDVLCRQFAARGWQRVAAQGALLMLQTQFPLISYNAYAQLASVGVACLLVAAWRRRTLGWFIGLGAGVGATVWLLQTRGLTLLLVGLGAAVATGRWRLAAAFLGGFAAVSTPWLAWPPSLVRWHLGVFPLTHYAGTNFVSLVWFAVAALWLLALAAVARWLYRPIAGFWPLWWLAAAHLGSVWSRADWVYVTQVLWPWPVLIIALRPMVVAGWRAVARTTWQTIVAALATCAFGVAVTSVAVFLALLPLRLPSDPWGQHEPFWERLAAIVRARTAPNEPIFATPMLSNLYFFAQRPNATRHNWLLSSLHPDELFQQTLEDLQRRRPRLVIRELGSRATLMGFHRDGTVVDEYLTRHYRVSHELTEFSPQRIQVLERLPE